MSNKTKHDIALDFPYKHLSTPLRHGRLEAPPVSLVLVGMQVHHQVFRFRVGQRVHALRAIRVKVRVVFRTFFNFPFGFLLDRSFILPLGDNSLNDFVQFSVARPVPEPAVSPRRMVVYGVVDNRVAQILQVSSDLMRSSWIQVFFNVWRN